MTNPRVIFNFPSEENDLKQLMSSIAFELTLLAISCKLTDKQLQIISESITDVHIIMVSPNIRIEQFTILARDNPPGIRFSLPRKMSPEKVDYLIKMTSLEAGFIIDDTMQDVLTQMNIVSSLKEWDFIECHTNVPEKQVEALATMLKPFTVFSQVDNFQLEKLLLAARNLNNNAIMHCRSTRSAAELSQVAKALNPGAIFHLPPSFDEEKLNSIVSSLRSGAKILLLAEMTGQQLKTIALSCNKNPGIKIIVGPIFSREEGKKIKSILMRFNPSCDCVGLYMSMGTSNMQNEETSRICPYLIAASEEAYKNMTFNDDHGSNPHGFYHRKRTKPQENEAPPPAPKQAKCGK